MPRRYPLDAKINALNQIDQLDGDIQYIAKQLKIPFKTVENWRADEDHLRQQYQQRQHRHFTNLKFELLADMLERCRAIMKKIDDSAITEASVSQLAYTLTTLLNHAVRLEEAFEKIEEEDQQENSEIVLPNFARLIHNGRLHDSPPGAKADSAEPLPFQSRSLREALGQIGTGTDSDPRGRPS